MIAAIIVPVWCLVLTLLGFYKCSRYMDRSENEFVQNTCFLEAMFFLIMFLIQMAVYTGLFVYFLPLM